MATYQLWIDDEFAEQLRAALDDLGQYGGRIETTWHAGADDVLFPVVVSPRSLSVGVVVPVPADSGDLVRRLRSKNFDHPPAIVSEAADVMEKLVYEHGLMQGLLERSCALGLDTSSDEWLRWFNDRNRALTLITGEVPSECCGHKWRVGSNTHVCDRVAFHTPSGHLCHCGEMLK